jgi:phosphoglycolate phosphatase
MSAPARPTTPVVLVVFDLDGTLVDSWKDLAVAANLLVREYGGQTLVEESVASMVGDGAGALVARAFAAAGLGDAPPEALPRFLAIYDQHLLDHTVAYPGIREILADLATRARLAVLTNKPGGATRRVIEGVGLASFFSHIVAGDGVFARKPDPAGLLHLMREAGATAAGTLLVGDSENDLETARRAGTSICLARYGFGCRLTPEALRGDEFIVDSPEELIGIVSR